MHRERHRLGNMNWLRAAVLGANDGLLSTSSLVLGVAAAHGTRRNILVAGVAGLVAGAMSMAAGEYVSVSSQADTEKADLAREKAELASDPEGELEELADIYVERGLGRDLALQVATQLMQHDALQAHARDELGITEFVTAQPVQAALASAASFGVGASVPLIIAIFFSGSHQIFAVFLTALLSLVLLGSLAAQAGGADLIRGATRVLVWGVIAMGVTLTAGFLFGGGH